MTQYSDLNMRWTTEVSGFQFPTQVVSFLISAACRRGLGPTQWVLAALFRGRWRGGHEAVHSPVCGAEFKK
jgi:hypothetical protein